MTKFTADNWNGTDLQIETANIAFDEAWGAIKGFAQRTDTYIDAYQIKQSLADAINNEFTDGIGHETLAEAALTRIGFTPERTVHSLECK